MAVALFEMSLLVDSLCVAFQSERGRKGYAEDLRASAGLCHATWDEEQIWNGLVHLHRGRKKRTHLMYAAYKGEVERVRWLLQRGARLESEDAEHCTALGWASKFGHAVVVQELLHRGADVRGGARESGSALIDAAHGGHYGVAAALLKWGATLSIRELETLLSVCNLSPELLSSFCDRTVDFEGWREEGRLRDEFVGAEDWRRVRRDALHSLSCRIGNLGWLPVDDTSKSYLRVLNARSLLSLAALEKTLCSHPAFIINACLSLHEAGAAGFLREAARCGALDRVRVDDTGTALDTAIHHGRADVVAALLSAGAVFNVDSLFVLNYVSERVLEILLLSGPALKTRMPALTAGKLFFAAMRFRALRVLKALLGDDEDTETNDDTVRVCHTLLWEGRDDDGFTPLMKAAAEGAPVVVSLFLEHGAPAASFAPPRGVDGRPVSALSLAASAGVALPVRELLAHGAADGENGLDDLRDATMLAAAAGHTGVLKELFECVGGRGLPNARDPSFQGRTPLHWAASGGHVSAVLFLLGAGAKADAVAHGSPGKTASMVAKEAGFHELAQRIRSHHN
jgi:ankyrin repeat protein